MAPERLRLALLLALLASSAVLFFAPPELAMNSERMVDDPIKQRIEQESVADAKKSMLVLRIKHDDGGLVSNNLTRVQALLQLEQDILSGSDPETAWIETHVWIHRIESPISTWESAFASRNRSLSNASQWADVMQPIIEQGWCGNESTEEEQAAFESSLLLLPRDTNLGIACPSFPGASASQAPAADEMLWIMWMDSHSEDSDLHTVLTWTDRISDKTEFEVSAIGAKMLFNKARLIAENDMRYILFPSILLLGLILALGLRDPLVAITTIGGVVLVVAAELGILSLFGVAISVIDAVALPIIMGVAVDGAFWYCRSSRKRDEVRRMLLVAMLTTVSAVSLAFFSPIRAQRTLALVMVLGLILDWLLTRFILEDFYLSRRSEESLVDRTPMRSHPLLFWCWPVALLLLTSVALVAPAGFKVLDVEQFLPEDDSSILEMHEISSEYVLASSATTWIAVDADGDSEEELRRVQVLQRQLGQHPSIITFDTGVVRSPMVFGIPTQNGSSIDQVSGEDNGTLLLQDSRLQRDGVTSGVAIIVLIDVQNVDAAIQFGKDARNLISSNGFEGGVGGDLIKSAELTKEFDEERMTQIILAGLAVYIVAWFVLRSPLQAARIAIGTLAVGIAIDGMASLITGRGIITAPAVLLGMGFTADYLSHASVDHAPTRRDNSARWWAAFSSLSAFVLLSFATFPPAKESGQLLIISIIFSVVLATCLSFQHLNTDAAEQEE